MDARTFSRKLHSRAAAFVMIAVAAVYLLLFSGHTNLMPNASDFGIWPAITRNWLPSAATGLVINLVVNGLIMLLMAVINRAYNVLRAMTWLEIGLFAIMQAAVPYEVVSLNAGSFLCLGVLLCLLLMFRSYGSPDHVYSVFLTFFCLSLGVTVQYSFAFYIPLFWVVCAQMRVLTPRSFIASVLGLATVWIILLGFGIIGFGDIRIPQITSVFSALELDRVVYLLVVIGVTAFMLVTSIALNVLKTIAYNAQARAFNGALTLVAAVTIIAMAANYNNVLSYLPLLNTCAAYQITHYFVNHRYDRQYIAVFAVIAVYITLYIWRL